MEEPKTKRVSSNRKNAQATRTLRACELCRRQKTRCFRVNDNSNSCLRCTFVNKPCSFASGPPPASAAIGITDSNTKIDLIYNGVQELLSIVKNRSGVVNSEDARVLLEAANSMKEPEERMVLNPIDLENQTNFKSPTNSFEISPFLIMQNQAKLNFLPKNIESLLNLSTIKLPGQHPHNIVTLNILPFSEVVNLMNDFRRNYGRWISFPSNLPTEILIERLQTKSPLLLTTCCCISLRYSFNNVNPGDINSQMRRRQIFNSLVKQLVNELNSNLLKINCFNTFGGDIEFLQTLVILSIYSSSLTSVISSNNQALLKFDANPAIFLLQDESLDLQDLNFDPWFLSGLGLNLFISKTTIGSLIPKNAVSTPSITSPFTILYDEELDSNEYQILTVMRIYNHLILVHLINCIFSGRMCIVDEIRLNYCNITLGLPSSTNFDGRMVLEISILLITYNFIQINLNVAGLTVEELNLNLSSTLKEIKGWYDQWDYLFQQPALQFVEVCYNFCNLLILFSYNYQRYIILNSLSSLSSTALFNQDNVKFIVGISSDEHKQKMFEFSNSVLNFINLISNDSYFAYLSDQLHFCFHFAGMFLLKLLYILKRENALAVLSMHEVNELNSLSNVQLLIAKFGNIKSLDANDNDIISKFKNSLKHNLKKLFPEYA